MPLRFWPPVEIGQLLWDRLFKRRSERDVRCLVVSHRGAALERADQILVIEDGLVHARGTLAELLVT